MLRPEQPVGRVNGTHFSPRTISYIDDNKREEYLWQSPLLPGQNRLWLPPPCPPETDECESSDLYLLRDAAADERGAIADYLACAAETCLDEIFLDVAEDEMEHYAETMRLISWLDPVQAEMLAEEALDVLVMKRPIGKPKWATAKKAPEAADVAVPRAKRFARRSIITKAIQDELHAINKYQRYMNDAEEPRVKELFAI